MEGIEEVSKVESKILICPHGALLGIEFSRNLPDDKLGIAEHSDVADTDVSG